MLKLFYISTDDIKHYIVSENEDYAKWQFQNHIIQYMKAQMLKDYDKMEKESTLSELDFNTQYAKEYQGLEEKVKTVLYPLDKIHCEEIDSILDDNIRPTNEFKIEISQYAHYEKIYSLKGDCRYLCRNCYQISDKQYDYCPYCGSPMSKRYFYNSEKECLEELEESK